MNDLHNIRLGLEPGEKVLVQSLTLDGHIDGAQVRNVYGGVCEAVILVVPRGAGVIVETAITRELFRETTNG